MISGYPFKWTQGTRPRDEVKREFRKWWADVRRLGERAVLERMVRDPENQNPADAAKRLVSDYPAIAIDAIEEGIKVDHSDFAQLSLVGVLGSMPAGIALPLLSELSQTGSSLVRVMADTVIAVYRPDAGFPALEAEWIRLPTYAMQSAQGEWTIEEQIEPFLLASNRPDAVRAMALGMRTKTVEIRRATIEMIARPRLHARLWDVPYRADDANGPEPQAFLDAIESLLADELSDQEVWPGGMTDNGIEFHEPKMSELAVWALAKRFPLKYRWHAPLSTADNEEQRLAALVVYRGG
jgi:hypothetical protein